MVCTFKFAPEVAFLKYMDGLITCEADGNPLRHIEYNIILNGTKPSAPTGKTMPFNVEENYCTEVSCNVTNVIGTASRQLEEPLCPASATSLTIAVDGEDQSSGKIVTVTEDTDVTLSCTALGAIPQVSIDWFKGGNPLTPDTETIPPGVSPLVTSLTYRDGIITCDAEGNPLRHIEYYIILNGTKPNVPTGKTLGFNVDDNYCTDVSCNVTNAIGTGSRKLEEPLCPVVPEVTSLTYRDGIITCDADANPLRHIEYYIILNGTKPSAPTGKTMPFNVEDNYCTEVSCNVTNAIGTGSRQLENPLCPAAATSLTIAVDGGDQSSGAKVTVTEDTNVTLTCTALGAIPRVSIDWFNGGNPLTSDTETIPPGVVPVVISLTYMDGIINCDADANPLRHIEYYIILNGTKPNAPTGKTLAFNVDDNYCTEVSCNVTNAIGTGSRKLEEPLCPGSSLVGIIVGSVVAAIVIVAVVGGLAFVVWRRRHKQQQTETCVNDGLNDIVSQGADSELPPLPVTDQSSPGLDPHHPNDIPLEPIASAVVCESISNEDGVEASNDVAYGNVGPELSFSRDLVVIENELGRGEFGRVLLGKALGIEEAGKETKVAVKTVKEGADRHAKNELVAELQVMKTVGSHPNVVKLLGYCAEKDPVYVIVEYLAKGDLKEVLMEFREKDPGASYSNLPGVSKSLARTLVKFARDVANGMAYISSQKYVHRDLAARNVLVGDDLVCKVSDFGLARDVMNTRIYQRESQGPLPMRWMALESIRDDVYTTKSDVWSFGILLWEIVTLGARPYPLLRATTMISKLQQGYRMPKPRQCKKTLYKMMCSCWQESPKDRPSFQSLYRQLNDMVSEDQDYITMGNLDKRIYEVQIVEDTKEKL
ncbi:fibroblast growth factor receptor 3-like [Patiria miniata]|uniref:receptor protein-tyrosine kinase n=1 Tax=Patiria miniata TaxID=46514 RepID=A0A914AF59_PATMI|nr:fibroblast growth factor receptor 3-like [Patiria miniata]